MWKFDQASDEQLDSILYFLCSALSSAIDDGDYLCRNSYQLPDIRPGLGTEEISSRLAAFREQIWDVGNCEALVLTKISRAREWAVSLRRHEPHLRADIDAFMSATAACEPLSRRIMPDANALFDGAAQPRRFFARRMGPLTQGALALAAPETNENEADEAFSGTAQRSYMIAGVTSMSEIIDACDRLLVRLSQHYGWDEMSGDIADEALGAGEADRETAAEPRDDGEAETLQEAAEADSGLEGEADMPDAQAGSEAAEDAEIQAGDMVADEAGLTDSAGAPPAEAGASRLDRPVLPEAEPRARSA